MSAQEQGKYERDFTVCKNKFRGLASDFKSKKFVKNRRFDPSYIFRSGYRDLMLEARSVLHPSKYSEYLNWVSLHIKNQLPELSRYPTEYDELAGVSVDAPTISLEKEILWIVARIKENADVINSFREISTHIEKLVINTEFGKGIDVLKKFEMLLGASFWSIQLRISLENLTGGLENQKKYTTEVRSIYRKGLLNFIAYNTSIRNEDRVSIQKYVSDIRHRIINHSKYDDSVKNYMLHRMLGEWSNDEKKIADVLRVEQSHSIIDMYETFISLLQRSFCDDAPTYLKDLIKTAIKNIDNIDDFRLEKARSLLGIPLIHCDFIYRDDCISEALLSGNLAKATRCSRIKSLGKQKKIDAWHYIYAAAAFSFNKESHQQKYQNDISYLLSNLLKADASASTSFNNLLKIVTNFSGLPVYAAIKNFIDIIYRLYPDDVWCFDSISLNTPAFGIEDGIINPNLKSNHTVMSWSLLNNPIDNSEIRNKDTQSLFNACGHIKKQNYCEAIHALVTYCNYLPALQIPLLLNAYYSADMRQDVIKLIANEGTRYSSRLELIPIVNSLTSYYKEDFNRVEDLLIAPIALHMLWNETENEAIGSQLRFKAAQVIKKKDVQSPAALFNFRDKIKNHLLVYFLREVCVPNIIDQVRIVKTTKAILEQRQETCSVLRDLDNDRASDYEDEIMLITNRQIMSAGQWIVDRTRIHVDVTALSRWANRELSEDFYRYRDLAKVSTSTDFDEVMRDLLLENPIFSQFNEFDEADAVLYSMLIKLSNEFLNNSLFGLDYYLSKRIRHQSFIGLIRGPLELSNIITSKETGKSGYNKNVFWLEKLSSCSKETLNELEKIFNKFSTSFDKAILETKDNIIQIKSKDHPHGLITFDINPQIIPVARILLQDGDISNFVTACVGLMWALLDKSLRDVQEYISTILKPNVSIIFDEFRAELKKLIESKPEYYELSRAIGESSVQVQLALDDASSWFEINNDAEALRRTFNINQAIAISLEAAKKCLRSFEPNIIVNDALNNINVMPSTLVFLHDVLFVSLDNTRVHSGLKKPRVSIEVIPDTIAEKFIIRTRSQAKPNVRIDSEKKLAEIRDKIERGEYDTKTKTEGGSGLYKIAAVVKQSAIGAIEFGFNSSGEFEIQVTYHFLVQAKQVEGFL